ncbi:MAG: helix-turn-helix domain-containing protein [Alphaproteobacteria bacterium]|nr:helix-turn-helix domain-containing protein [Alphaproteobacteria bacterium]
MTDELAYTISQFCKRFQVSRAGLYVLLKEKKAPPTYKVGYRRYISVSAAREWQARLEEEESTKVNPLGNKDLQVKGG